VPQAIYNHTFENGLTLVAEQMPHVRSAAFTMLIPAGAVNDPIAHPGLAGMVTDMLTRGAGSRNSRELLAALDNLGLDHSESTGIVNVQFAGSTLSRNLLPSLSIYADIVRRPHFPADELEATQSLAVQDIASIEDEPQGKVMIELRKHYHPSPINRDFRGTVEGVESATIESVRSFYESRFHPTGVILSVAGDINWEELKDHVGKLFADWQGKPRDPLTPEPNNPKSAHLTKDLEQTQIALAYPSVPLSHPDFYAARGAMGVLSLDMSSRLFMNVREKHGLCYSVYATHESYRDRGTIVAYAGATPAKAQETLDRTLFELRNLTNGVEQDEVDRVKIGLKSGMIMRQESTSARASAIASDWYYLGRVRPLEELQASLNGITVDTIVDYATKYPADKVTLVTLGPEPMELK
jgi:predicted Zn-dependent peptidase